MSGLKPRITKEQLQVIREADRGKWIQFGSISFLIGLAIGLCF